MIPMVRRFGIQLMFLEFVRVKAMLDELIGELPFELGTGVGIVLSDQRAGESMFWTYKGMEFLFRWCFEALEGCPPYLNNGQLGPKSHCIHNWWEPCIHISLDC
jgi:hypothetical protein